MHSLSGFRRALFFGVSNYLSSRDGDVMTDEGAGLQDSWTRGVLTR